MRQNYVVTENETTQIVVPVADTTGLSKCDGCGKVTPYDRLMHLHARGVRWDVCSYECAEDLR